MKNLFFLLALMFSINAMAGKKGRLKWVTVYGMITQTADYCGGAAPSPEMKSRLNTPSPLEGKTIYIKIGNENEEQKPIIKKVVSDKHGRFSVLLKAGTTYMFLEDWKGEPWKKPQDTDKIKWKEACLREQYRQPDFVLLAKSGKRNEVNINFHQPCFFRPRCGEYSGELPN